MSASLIFLPRLFTFSSDEFPSGYMIKLNPICNEINNGEFLNYICSLFNSFNNNVLFFFHFDLLKIVEF